MRRDTDVTSRLSARSITLAYGDRTVVEGLDLEVPDGELTVIIGPNACGKSTLLRALARLLRPAAGTVELDGRDLRERPTRELAREVGLLPQSPVAPEGIGVFELVARGRYPHQRLFGSWSHDDQRAVAEAMEATGVAGLRDRRVAELSGGQRQRVWIAMALAQETPVLLLDEPTTYLDIAHQVEVLELVRGLRDAGRTVVAVLHEINHAARYATNVVAMRDGRIVRQGEPGRIITEDLVREVFDLDARVIADPDTGTPVVLPRSALRTAPTR
ncbi:ABC transporter ATP-binding protein [Tsukamurella sp. M9C]|uniref:ABC transporter ATP-binding protein n=1 Tax=unclassified Tsukamurella TaxID=2633480 RepID=UPI001CCE3621|nr:ABC transporter ATP-binding protein [Tsukamurella sp. M9C]MCA0157296.1 ABC transporter ATP-binding protein [Tsukamurella sp. M9C]